MCLDFNIFGGRMMIANQKGFFSVGQIGWTCAVWNFELRQIKRGIWEKQGKEGGSRSWDGMVPPNFDGSGHDRRDQALLLWFLGCKPRWVCPYFLREYFWKHPWGVVFLMTMGHGVQVSTISPMTKPKFFVNGLQVQKPHRIITLILPVWPK